MSRTDKDRPWWVVNFQEDGYIDHDHRSGECIEETLELAKFYSGSKLYRRHHHCKKLIDIEISCHREKINGKKQTVFDTLGYSDKYIRNKQRGQLPCWSRVCDNHTHDEYDYLGRVYCTDKINTKCLGHMLRTRDNSIPCACDEWPEKATCGRYASDTRGGYRRYTWGGVPSWFVRENYHGPERRRERELRDMAREYNAYGDIEDDDFFNRQAKNSAHWDWW